MLVHVIFKFLTDSSCKIGGQSSHLTVEQGAGHSQQGKHSIVDEVDISEP